MSRDRILPITDAFVAEHGEALLFAVTTNAREFEDWVCELRVALGMDGHGNPVPRVDWNYSGTSTARLLYTGGRERVFQAVLATLPHRGVEMVLRWTGDEAAVIAAIEPEPFGVTFGVTRVEICTECNSTNTSTISIHAAGYRGLEHTCLHCGHTWGEPG